MGCGGSKSQPKEDQKEGKSKKRSPTKSKRHSVGSTKTDSSPSAQRREPRQKKQYVPKRRESSEPIITVFQRTIPAESEKLPLNGNWELESGNDDDVTLTMADYPVCKAPKQSSAHDKMDYQNLDRLGMQVCPRMTSFQDIAKDMALAQKNRTDLEKVRLLVVWMCVQRIRTLQYGADAKEGTPLGYMKKIKEGSGTFAALLAQLCRSVDIPCVIIKGYCKTATHVIGMDGVRENKCTWNAVHVDGQWQLVHPFLICTPLSQQPPTEGWTLVESSIEERPQNTDTYATFNGFFFAPKPWDFIHVCIPEENMHNWQLLEKPIAYSRFLELPFLRSVFYARRFTLVEEDTCKGELKTQNGFISIRIRGVEPNLKDSEIKYDLYRSSEDNDTQTDAECGNFVFCGRTEDMWTIQIRCYTVGVFKLSLYGLSSEWFYWLCDFMITCDQPSEEIHRPPSISKNERLGPTNKTEEAGLLCASHQGGVIFFKPKENHVVKFLINRRIRTHCELEGAVLSPEELAEYVKKTIHKNEMDFIFNLPFSGEYLLKIFVVDESEQNEKVCVYWLTDADDTKTRENVFQRKARWNLRETTAGSDLELLEAAIEKCKKCKLGGTDEDFLRAKRRLKYLKLKKGLRDGQLRRHEEVLDNAIYEAENSEFKDALKPSLDRCHALQYDISKLEMYCHPVLEMNHATISELANYNNPPQDVHSIMKAAYLLLGEEMNTLKNWGNIQGLLRRTNRESIKHRVKEFQENGGKVDEHTEKQVENVLKEMPKSYALSASLSATTFYEWLPEVPEYTKMQFHHIDSMGKVSNVLYGNKEMKNKSKNADDSLQQSPSHHIKYSDKRREQAEDDDMFQDEGFLDSYDLDKNSSTINDDYQ